MYEPQKVAEEAEMDEIGKRSKYRNLGSGRCFKGPLLSGHYLSSLVSSHTMCSQQSTYQSS